MVIIKANNEQVNESANKYEKLKGMHYKCFDSFQYNEVGDSF